jgi:pimeloyl-ACP methyl ester carboxylesterase
MSDVKYVELHGERVAYRDAGSGEVVVLIHGMAGSSDTWEAVIPHLARRHRVIAPDLLGHGQSDKPRTDYSLGAFAAGLRDLLDELRISRATIVGHSLGGGVAMQFIYQHPEYCQRLILVSSGGLGPDVGWILRLLASPGVEFVLPVVAPKVVLGMGNHVRSWLNTVGLGSPRAGQVWAAYSSLSDPPAREAFLRTLRSVVDYRGQSVSALSRLRLRAEVPTLVVWGDSDHIIPVEHGYGVRAARPGSRLQVLAGLGHFPHVEAPAEVASAIEEFIATSTEAPAMQTASQSRKSCTNGLFDDLRSHEQIESAVGVLAELRRCSPDEAVEDFIDGVRETGVRAADLGQALTDLAAGHQPQSHIAEASQRWGHLLALRGRTGEHGVGAVHSTVRVRYGPRNRSTIC